MEETELRLLAEAARRNLAELIPDEDERRRADGDLARALSEPPGEREDRAHGGAAVA